MINDGFNLKIKEAVKLMLDEKILISIHGDKFKIINNNISQKINNYKFPRNYSDDYPYDYILYNHTKFNFLKFVLFIILLL